MQNDTYKHVDLSCLDFEDAISIAKQKIFDCSAEVRRASMKHQKTFYYILNIKCAEDHMVSISDYYGKQRIKNCILEMIKHELSIDNYYNQ